MFILLDRLTSRFIWQGRRPRVRYKVLQLPKPLGGWGLPNFRNYWLASQLRAMTVWMADKFEKRWLDIEKNDCPLMPIGIIPFNSERTTVSLGRWSMTTFKAWKKVQRIFNLPVGVTALSNIQYLSGFMPLRINTGFRDWRHLNLEFIHQLVSDNKMKSFDQLTLEFGLPRSDFFRYPQMVKLST